MLYLKVSTAVTVKIGPFVDSTDGNTVEDGLTVSQADVRLSKNGGDFAQKNDASACTHDEIGYYDCDLDITDTGTLGRLQVVVHEGGALPVYHEYMVVTANWYDTMCSTDVLNVEITAAGVDSVWDETLTAHATADSSGLALKNLLKIGKNKWANSGVNFTIYDDDGTTPLYVFTYDSATAATTRTPA